MYTKILNCRVCNNRQLVPVVDLSEQYLTGVFPHDTDMSKITKGPLRLVKCHGDNACGLLQLEHTYSLSEMYGQNYGYRSGLNQSMVQHLKNKVAKIIHAFNLEPNDLVIDIGSNDGTTLSYYPDNLDLVGIDPTGSKFKEYYPKYVKLIPDFFSAELGKKFFGDKKAKIVTSFSMFYDLDSPVNFAKDIASILDQENGVWVFEQSYMPLMLETNSYDTICHEHLEYYGLHQIMWIVKMAGLKVVDVETNGVNGGSFSVTASLGTSNVVANSAKINSMLSAEKERGLLTLQPYFEFAKRIEKSRQQVRDFVFTANKAGKRVCGLGASTKGNVLLQFCNFSKEDIEVIADVNPDKFGAYAPGSCIPILDEKKVLATKPDYLLVLPWHFRDFFLNSPSFKNQHLVFPLPSLEIVEVK